MHNAVGSLRGKHHHRSLFWSRDTPVHTPVSLTAWYSTSMRVLGASACLWVAQTSGTSPSVQVKFQILAICTPKLIDYVTTTTIAPPRCAGVLQVKIWGKITRYCHRYGVYLLGEFCDLNLGGISSNIIMNCLGSSFRLIVKPLNPEPEKPLARGPPHGE